MITMLLGGLWHGASWNFVIWGGLHGLYLSIHKIILRNQQIDCKKMKRFSFLNGFNVIITYLLVLFTWVFFRATSWHSTQIFFNKIIYWEKSEYTLLFITITLSYMIIMILIDLLEYTTGRHTYILEIKSNGIKVGILTALLLIIFIYMFQADPLPFIYFQF